MGVEHVAVAKVVVARCDVVDDATDGKGALKNRWAPGPGIALVVHGDARPSEGIAGVVRGASGIGTHAVVRDVRGDDLAPVCFDGGREEGFGVRDDALSGGVGVIVDDAR